MKKKEDIKKDEYKGKSEVIDLKEFMVLKAKEQDELIRTTLDKLYDSKVEIKDSHIDKVLNVAFDSKDNDVFLPYSLNVSKEGTKLIFSFKKDRTPILILLFLLGFLFLAGFATYNGIQLLAQAKLDIDLDGDGIADLNIDLDDDGICDINCDTDGDKKPDKNIDYQHNLQALFNVSMADGSIFNEMNQDLDDDGVCDLNCDTDDDGWPDINIDIDGDGIADINIDEDNDKVPDWNIDTDGDMVADVNVDEDGDGICDKNCIYVIERDNKSELNVDLDGDGICDINCDTDNDGKPDENIDYQGNNKPIFNVLDEDGNLTNKVDQDTDNDGVCDLNCDVDNDGWPDTNIDLDGDGVPDINIDNNNDGVPDVNIDTNNDGKPDFNIDNDGDGVCDEVCTNVYVTPNKSELNVDLDGDGICDVNCDTNNDGKPDENIDYQGSNKPTFNVPDEDGNLTNKTNQDTNKDAICDINCDVDNDGWPDTNIDLDGDGVPDINIDTNHDNTPDLNIDTDGDGTPDFNIDTDNDGVCDSKCTYVGNTKTGTYTTGENGVTADSAALIVTFASGNDVSVDNLYPDDQQGDVNTKVDDITFTIKNNSNETLYYNINWINVENTFESGNFWYKVTSTNSGFNQDYTSTPSSDATIASNVAIPANTTQTYTVSFTLHGTGEEQNYDQGKVFNGNISIKLIED